MSGSIRDDRMLRLLLDSGIFSPGSEGVDGFNRFRVGVEISKSDSPSSPSECAAKGLFLAEVTAFLAFAFDLDFGFWVDEPSAVW